MRPGPKPRLKTPEEIAAKKAVKAAYDREYRKKNADKVREAKKAYGKSDAKKAADKRWVEANRERSREIKKAWKERNPDAGKAYYEKNKERCMEQMRAYGAKNADKARQRAKGWRDGNIERARATYRRFYRENRQTYISRARARNQHISNFATPAWSDKEKIADIYRRAAEQRMHVDHIIPLKGKLVCGLHVPENLQLLSSEENMRKGNRYACE